MRNFDDSTHPSSLFLHVHASLWRSRSPRGLPEPWLRLGRSHASWRSLAPFRDCSRHKDSLGPRRAARDVRRILPDRVLALGRCVRSCCRVPAAGPAAPLRASLRSSALPMTTRSLNARPPQAREDAWGPPVVPELLHDVPYAPFSKFDRLGKAADWTASTYGRPARRTRQYQSGQPVNTVFNFQITDDAQFQASAAGKRAVICCVLYLTPRSAGGPPARPRPATRAEHHRPADLPPPFPRRPRSWWTTRRP